MSHIDWDADLYLPRVEVPGDPILQGSYFTWAEVARTNHRSPVDHEARNRQLIEASPTLQANAVELARTLLDPLRAYFQSPIVVNSWYRNLELNALVNGNPHSDHLRAAACDFRVYGLSVEATFLKVRDWLKANGAEWGQLIAEPINRTVVGDRWLHLSLPSDAHRGEVIT